ncbi:hypothetical protein SAMN05428987_5154 [Paenibacillus sp. CF095]|uniref:hypothetical protein n=1 Tax=Paenibacillus sp. CF095 TaxID=1881033 RepID=UPI000887E855|nr:hypothetical protein [Paenibacillus sp. CF095]SDD53095.1 hypothetical protein SAMN05428987_5154 [Paenibacillus sp. CF095]
MDNIGVALGEGRALSIPTLLVLLMITFGIFGMCKFVPVTGAFASNNTTDRIKPNTIDSRLTIEPGSDEVTIMSAEWLVTQQANIRKTASPNGEHVLAIYPYQKVKLISGRDYTVVNGVTWVYVTITNLPINYSGYILLSALTEIG